MNPNNTQPGQVNGGQPAHAPQAVTPINSVSHNTPKTVAPKKKDSKNKGLILGVVGILVVAGAITAAVILLNKNSDTKTINYDEENKIGLNTIRASEVDPTNYELSEQDKDATENAASDYLDALEMDVDAFLAYFKEKINAQLDKNNTDEALRLLWREQDLLQDRGFNELVQKILLEMDTSKLVNFQKVYLYRAIVTASAMVGDQETLDKYAAMVDELDPPEQYIKPADTLIDDDIVPEGTVVDEGF